MEQAVNFDRIISDNGSGYVKLGYGGDSFPRHIFPSIVGRPVLKSNQQVGEVELKNPMIGDECIPVRAMLEISYPLIEGVVKDWDQMEEIWNYSFYNKLGLKQE